MRFLIVGCGSIGKRHLSNLRLLSAGEVMAYDTKQERREELRQIVEFSRKFERILYHSQQEEGNG